VRSGRQSRRPDHHGRKTGSIADEAVQSAPTVAVVVGGTDIQHGIVAGAGARPVTYLHGPQSTVPMPPPTHPDSRFYGTTELPNRVEKIAGAVQDALHKEWPPCT
jgi:hypothetical protein